jgi:methylmalonyl-CoA mutase cobalamin-binding subunit
MEITVHTGCAGDFNKINIAWFDENGVEKITVIEVNILEQDKPRTLEIKIDEIFAVQIPAGDFARTRCTECGEIIYSICQSCLGDME